MCLDMTWCIRWVQTWHGALGGFRHDMVHYLGSVITWFIRWVQTLLLKWCITWVPR